MTDALIERFTARLRLPADPAEAVLRQAHLEEALKVAVNEHLDAALARLSVGEEIVLVRRIAAPVRIGQGSTTWQAGLAWSEAIAAAVEQQLREPASGEVVRFRRRLDALVAFIEAMIEGDKERDWAWRRLGFTGASPDSPSAFDRALAVPMALTAAPAEAAPALRRLADRGSLAEMAQAIDVIDVQALADFLTLGLARAEEIAAPAEELVAALVGEPAGWSTRAGHSFAQAIRRASPAAAAAWARIAVLILEGHRVAAGRTPLRRLADRWLAAALGATRQSSFARDEARSRRPEPEPKRRAAAFDELFKSGGIEDGSRPVSKPAWPATDAPARSLENPAPASGPEPIWTAFGGLLLLLPLVAECGAGDTLFEVEDQAALSSRLHALAMMLAPQMAPADPSALAFAGLSEPPAAPGPCLLVVEEAAARVVAALADRLPDWLPETVLERVVTRAATLQIEPGWIEVHFGIDHISPEIRRAGLDLDPGYLPWRGLVLKYRYV